MRKLLFVILPLMLSSQSFDSPDTIFTSSGLGYPCILETFSPSSITGNFGRGTTEPMVIAIVDRVYLQGKGEIFTKEEGYKIDPAELNEFCALREMDEGILTVMKLKDPKKRAQANEDAGKTFTLPGMLEDIKTIEHPVNRFSFGFSYNPIHAQQFVKVASSYYPPSYSISIFSGDKVVVVPEFTFYVSKKIGVFINASYHSMVLSEEYYYTYEEDNSAYSDTANTISSSETSVFTPQLGVKYLFGNPDKQRSRAYFAVSVGQSYGKSVSTVEDLYEEEKTFPITVENWDEFNSDLNSPFIMSFASGAEYQFNSDLSFFVRGTLSRSLVKATYHYSRKYEDGDFRTTNRDHELTQDQYSAGFGFHFYF